MANVTFLPAAAADYEKDYGWSGTKRIAWIAIVWSLCCIHAHGGEAASFPPWKVVSAADWHSAEGGVTALDPADFEANQVSEKRLIKGTLFCQPDVVLIAGDVGSGHWTMAALTKKRIPKPGETIEDVIHRLGEKTYRSMKNNFAEAGVDRLFVCVGDHGIGDNDWPPGSARANCVPYHRSIFGRSYNTDDSGKWLWPETVCGVPARPLETKYKNTSFAVRHKNVLFVMVDIFHQEGPGDHLHTRHGSINPDLAGKHLAWFGAVLAAGRKDKGVRYIFVQAHTPTLPPVRGQSSSMMMAAHYEQSNLWRTMRKHEADLYFAGEVHATTVSKDPESDLVQIVTDRKMPTMITVHDDRLELQCFDRTLEADGSVNTSPLHQDHQLTIHKPAGDTIFRGGKGVLKPLDTRAVFIHYPFDILEPAPFGPDRSKPTSIRNHGELNRTYDARTRASKLVAGKLGKGLAFEKGGAVDVHGTGPFGFFDRTERTMAIWLKTSGVGKYNLICGGSGLKAKQEGRSGWMDLGLDNGRLFMRTDAGEAPAEGPRLNDDRWHHAAFVVMPNARTLADLRVYVDGAKRNWMPAVDASQKLTAAMGIYGISLGGSHRPVWAKSQRRQGVAYFDGEIDDFAAWYRALSSHEIRTLYQLANTRRLNASQVDRLLAQAPGM